MTSAGLRVLVVDDVAPALDEMCELLREAPGVASVVLPPVPGVCR